MHFFRRRLPRASGKPVYAIGNFDGLHLGHQAVIGAARQKAAAAGQKAGLISFEPHPRRFFASPDFARLTPLRTKIRLLERLGVDLFACLPFNRALAGLAAEDFIAQVLDKQLRASQILAGGNFRFGRGRQGDFALLAQQGARRGIAVHRVEAVQFDAARISSSAVRAALALGEMRLAADLLGRWWMVSGRVRHGDARGAKLGFPTANLPAPNAARFGVYAVKAALEGEAFRRGGMQKIFNGVANLGRRPSFPGDTPLLEVHLFDFDGDLYGQRLAIWPLAFLRPEQRFDGLEALRAQIGADKQRAQAILAELDKTPLPPFYPDFTPGV